MVNIKNINAINIILVILSITLLFGCNSKQIKKEERMVDSNKPAKVELKNNNGQFQIYVNNEPFYIKGAGLEFGNIASVAKHGGNSFRTWRTENGQQSGKEVLDEALKNGLMVTMGIEVARERHGFDYNDAVAVKEQLDRIKEEVIALKDHPALFIWAIGNELNLRATNPKVWDAVNDISKMIHQVDPNHLTTTTLAGISKQVAMGRSLLDKKSHSAIHYDGSIYTYTDDSFCLQWDGTSKYKLFAYKKDKVEP